MHILSTPRWSPVAAAVLGLAVLAATVEARTQVAVPTVNGTVAGESNTATNVATRASAGGNAA